MIAFRAHRGGVNQAGGWNVGSYTMLQWPATAFENGGRLVNGVWTPVQAGEAPALVQLSAQVWVVDAFNPNGNNPVQCALPNPPGNPAQYVAKLIKNAYPGEDIGTGFGSLGAFQNTQECYLPAVLDIANPGDTYSMWLFVSHAAAQVDGNKAHTWWSGLVI